MSFGGSTGRVYACVRCRVTVHVDAGERVQVRAVQCDRAERASRRGARKREERRSERKEETRGLFSASERARAPARSAASSMLWRDVAASRISRIDRPIEFSK